MGNIKLLDINTVNKIAAGEVVINPASVVKELVENSLDAGSTRITVEIVSGGIEQIKVTDNGTGILPEDMEYAFKRHATSKITQFEDLKTVDTLGFRGEALASIAAVSRVKLTSRRRGETGGSRIFVEAGVQQSPVPIGCAEGTTMKVNDLFFNVPARHKFLKSISRETAAVNEVVSRLAMAFPNTAFKLKNNGRMIFETYGDGNLLSTISAILGREAASQMVPVNSFSENFNLKGFVSNPFYGRSSRKYQYFYVNQRWVANPSLRYALDHVYRTYLTKGRYPAVVLLLETKAPLVDVNVDPTKNTLRFAKEKEVIDFIIDSVRNALSGRPRTNITGDFGEYKIMPGKEEGHYRKRGQIAGHFPEKEGGQEAQQLGIRGWEKDMPEHANYIHGWRKTLTAADPGPTVWNAENRENIKEDYGDYGVLAQLAGRYILYEKNRNLYVVDQHAAHERVRYESIKEAGTNEVRQLVVPQTVFLTPPQMALVEQLSDILEAAGFQFDYFGDDTLVLREIPIEAAGTDPGEVLSEILDGTDTHLDSCMTLKEAFITSLACATAVKAGQVLSQEEMESLLEALFSCTEPRTCPHGRPTTLCISETQMLKEFKRV